MTVLEERGTGDEILATESGDLGAVGLDELLELAELQTRRDRKYIIPVADARRLMSSLPEGTRVLTIDGRTSFRYESVYFDTPERISYLLAARRRPRRFKVRTRTYVDSDMCMLEVKVRDGRGNTVKHRQAHDAGSAAALDDAALEFVSGIGQVATTALVDTLTAALVTRYHRTTMLIDDTSRVTFDVDLSWEAPGHGTTSLDGVVLIETKTIGRPCAIDRILWSMGHRPTTISKYCTGLAALSPELPANKWTRPLQRWFGEPPQLAHSQLTASCGRL